jgi:flavorubredoxin
MKETFTAQKVAENIYWVGAIDWKIRDFHGYATHRGTTYNAFLVMTDKITLIDTVKAPFLNQLMSRIASVVDPSRIDYIVSNHAEMDHTGCLPQVIDLVKPEKVFASTMGVKAISNHFGPAMKIDAVKDGDTLDLGNASLNFVETRMLHWPDSMLTYMPEQELLFSQDGFGMHLASSERFDDELADWLLETEAAKYFANILLPFSAQVSKVLERVTELGIPIKTIAPDHGPIWRKDPMKIVNLYSHWAKQEATKKAVIVYDTMWESTATMAHAVGDGIMAEGMQIKMIPLKYSHRSDLATELLQAGALVVGSPTMNNNLFPTVADALTYIKGLKPKNLVGGTFGSYGWSGEGVAQVTEMMRAMKIDLVSDGVKSNYVPTDDVLAECHTLGVTIAKRVKERFFTE